MPNARLALLNLRGIGWRRGATGAHHSGSTSLLLPALTCLRDLITCETTPAERDFCGAAQLAGAAGRRFQPGGDASALPAALSLPASARPGRPHNPDLTPGPWRLARDASPDPGTRSHAVCWRGGLGLSRERHRVFSSGGGGDQTGSGGVSRSEAAATGQAKRRSNSDKHPSMGEVLEKLAALEEAPATPMQRAVLLDQGRMGHPAEESGGEGFSWEVLEFRPGGGNGGAAGVEVVEATPEFLGLAPRDVSLFAATTGPGKQRATISVRGKELLFRSECCRAIVRADRAFLFPCRRQADTVRLAHALRANISRASNGNGNGSSVGDGHSGTNPFEFKVLECLLASTVGYFEGKAARLTLLTDSVLADVMEAVSASTRSGGIPRVSGSRVDLQQLLPIQRSLTELTADVQETSDAIAAVANDDAALAAICLSEHAQCKGAPPLLKAQDHKQTSAMYRGAGLLESYQRQVQSMDGALRELEENIDTVREVWHMSLDHTRNRTLQLNLAISIASFALMTSTVPASLFGMNLHSGIEESSHLLWYVASGCIGLSAFTFAGILASHRMWPDRTQERKVRDLGATKELLAHHLNDLDTILAALRRRHEPVSKQEFGELVGEAQRLSGAGAGLTQAEIDLLFKAFDTNRDGRIDAGDAARSQQDLARREAGRAMGSIMKT